MGLSLWFARIQLLEQLAWELPGPPMCSWVSGLCDLPRQASRGAVDRRPSVCGGTHAICQWRGVTLWAPLEEGLQSSRLVAWALII